MSNTISNDVRELSIEELEDVSGGNVLIVNKTDKGTLVISCASDGILAVWLPK
jgi:hypothetical protein